MTFDELVKENDSKKIVSIEIDAPLKLIWINCGSGIWCAKITPGDQLIEDDNGNFGHWGSKNTQFNNINSLNVDGVLYTEVLSVVSVKVTDQSWFYNSSNTNIYIHLEKFKPPEFFFIIAPGAVIGFTKGIDVTVNNTFNNVYYQPIITSVPNFSKKKDALFFGILQYKGGVITFDNSSGQMDNFAQLDLYGQPVRVKLTFEGLDFDQAKLVYTGRVGKFTGDFTSYKMKILDARKLFSRKLPPNTFNKIDFPDIADNLAGTPIPIIWGPVTQVPAYKTSSGNWTFFDNEFNNVDSGIIVYREDDTIFSHGGTETDGTFTGTDTDEKLTVTCRVSAVENGLDIIADALENYENRPFNSSNYLLSEWNTIKPDIVDAGIWLGKGNVKTSADIIQFICTANQGIFDVLSDGKFTFVVFDENKEPSTSYLQDELLGDPTIARDPDEYSSSVKIEHSKNWKTKESQLFTNVAFQDEVFARYRQYKEQPFDNTVLISASDTQKMSDIIMSISKFIFPTIELRTKTQKIETRILDNATYTYRRQHGADIIPESLYQVLGLALNLSTFEIGHTIKFIKEQIPVPSIPSDLNGSVYGLDVYGLDVYGL